MRIYDDLTAAKGSGTPYDQLTPISLDAINRLKAVGSVPDDYVDFVMTIGFGELGSSYFMLYEGLLEPDEIFGESDPKLDGLLLLGDDFQGFNTAFDTKDWSIVEIDPTNLQPIKVANSFANFIREKIDWAGR